MAIDCPVETVKGGESTATQEREMTESNSLHDEVHFRVLRLLEVNPNINQRELAQALGVSLGKTNFCLKALIAKGLIKIANFRNAQNKLAYAYLLTPSGFAEKADLTARFLKYKLEEFERLKHEIDVLKMEVR